MTGKNATWNDLAKAIAKMTPEQRETNLAVELQLSEEVLSSAGMDGDTPCVRLDFADEDHGILDEDHPVIIVQF